MALADVNDDGTGGEEDGDWMGPQEATLTRRNVSTAFPISASFRILLKLETIRNVSTASSTVDE